MKRPNTRIALIIAVGVLVVIGIATTITMVGTGQIGVVTNFGRVTGRELSEGIAAKLPYGIESVSVYDVKVQKETAATAAATKDLQDVTAEVVLNFHLNRGDVSKIHQEVGVLYKDKLISPALQEVFKSAAAKYNAGELITERASLKNDVYTQLKDRLEKYGIAVDDLSITDFKFSESFAGAIEDKQVAQQNAERAKFNLEAAKTDAEAQRVQSETLSDNYLKKQAIDKWDGKLPTYMGSGSVFNIPLQ